LSHRDFDTALKLIHDGKKCYLYTGRGPSAKSMHLGHLIPFMITKYLQDVFDLPLVIQITDDEKYLYKEFTMDEIKKMTYENIKDIIACGFNPNKTFIFINTQYIYELYPTILEIQKHINFHQVKSCFGIGEYSNIGQISFPAIQAAPSFSSCFTNQLNSEIYHCIIPCAIDQDPYFRVTRDVAIKINKPKPVILHTTFLPGLTGTNTKMSSSDINDAIFLSDTEKIVTKKINKAFSGGKDTLEEHRKYGGNPDVDICYQYLTFFMEDDNELQNIYNNYKSGILTSGELKKITANIINNIIKKYKIIREKITDEDIELFTNKNKKII